MRHRAGKTTTSCWTQRDSRQMRAFPVRGAMHIDASRGAGSSGGARVCRVTRQRRNSGLLARQLADLEGSKSTAAVRLMRRRSIL
jgi:hypothetical protein